MKKIALLPTAITLALGLTVGAAQADVVTTMISVDGVDSLTFVDARDGDAGGSLSTIPSQARGNFETKLVAGSAKTEDFSTAPYAPFVDDQTGFPVVDPLTGPIGAFGIPDAISLGIGNHYVQTARTDGGAGRFDPTSTADCTSGEAADCTARWFEASGDFTINFGTGYGAFGFYGTDFGDFAGSLTMFLLRDGAAEVEIIFEPFDDSDTGALGFFGFYDTVNRYTGVRFVVSPGEQDDFFGFDDLILGQVDSGNQSVPEPGSLALVGASLVALTAARRRRAGSNKA